MHIDLLSGKFIENRGCFTDFENGIRLSGARNNLISITMLMMPTVIEQASQIHSEINFKPG